MHSFFLTVTQMHLELMGTDSARRHSITIEDQRSTAVYYVTGSGDGYFAQGLEEGKSC
jgi:hypothetical protein